MRLSISTPNIMKTEPQLTEAKTAFLTLEGISKVYSTPTGSYPVLEGVDLSVAEGEFVCVIGHSGCGKSTLLNMVSGFNQPTEGEVRLENEIINEPGPDRMMVFQNYCLLPWKTVWDNVSIAVNAVYPDKPKEDKAKIVEDHLALVGLSEAAQKKPYQLSGGMKQRVAIARALSIRPKVLILDEPFGALDAITKEEMQEELLTIWREHQLTVLMITHDIDEALFLADRLVMMTNGPSAKIGEILEIPFARPRNRSQISEDPKFYELRNYALDFLFNRFAHDEDLEDGLAGTGEAAPKNRLALKIGGIIGGLALLTLVGWGIHQTFATKSDSGSKTPAIEAPARQ